MTTTAGDMNASPRASGAAMSGSLAGPPAAITDRVAAWVEDPGPNSSRGPFRDRGGPFPVVPSRTYLVHLAAPGWNVIGAARPWLPSIVAGHNDTIAWAMTPLAVDTQDIVVERVNPADPHQVLRTGGWVNMSVDFERVAVKGRDRPVEYSGNTRRTAWSSPRTSSAASFTRCVGLEPNRAAPANSPRSKSVSPIPGAASGKRSTGGRRHRRSSRMPTSMAPSNAGRQAWSRSVGRVEASRRRQVRLMTEYGRRSRG